VGGAKACCSAEPGTAASAASHGIAECCQIRHRDHGPKRCAGQRLAIGAVARQDPDRVDVGLERNGPAVASAVDVRQ